LQPFKAPPPGAGIQERLKAYDRYRISYDYPEGIRIGGKIPILGDAQNELAAYYDASGDSLAAHIMSDGNPDIRRANVLGTAGLIGSVAILVIPGGIGSLWMPLPYLGGLVGERIFLGDHADQYSKPAAIEFDHHLKSVLGLSATAEAQDLTFDYVPSPEGHSQARKHAEYVFVGIGANWVSNYDLSSDFLAPGAPASDNQWIDGYYGWQTDAGLGYVHPSGATLEARFDYVDRNQHGRYYNNGNNNYQPGDVLDMASIDWGLIPGYTFKIKELAPGAQSDLFVGWQFGEGLLYASGLQGDQSGNVLGTFGLRDTALAGGPVIRWRNPGKRHAAMALELGYRMEDFTKLRVLDRTGTYSGLLSPLTTDFGRTAFLDFSGPYLSLSFMFGWFQGPA
jgi:hypothetical protein